MGQQMGYRSLEWNWPKEATNRPIWAGIVDGWWHALRSEWPFIIIIIIVVVDGAKLFEPFS